MNILHVQYKINTFMNGDSRQVAFIADKGFRGYFITDKEKAKDKAMITPEYEIFSIKKIDLNWGFIFEK